MQNRDQTARARKAVKRRVLSRKLAKEGRKGGDLEKTLSLIRTTPEYGSLNSIDPWTENSPTVCAVR